MPLFSPYIPIDRRAALVEGRELPDRAGGSVLFADLSGFSLLTARFVQALGRKRGAEELLPFLNRVYERLIEPVHAHHGSVIHFSGDAVTCWFSSDGGARALSAAFEMQEAMEVFSEIQAPGDFSVALALKAAVSAGSVRRFVVGAPGHMLSDVLAGRRLEEVSHGERLAQRGEVLATEAVVRSLGAAARIDGWRTGEEGGRFAVLASLSGHLEHDPWPEIPSLPVPEASKWLLPAVAERLLKGEGHYLAELRPATALFLSFAGLDYDADPKAGEKLDAYVRWVQQVIEQYEGVLAQLTIGDKGAYFYIAFGAPVAHADDAERAVAAAMALRSPPDDLAFIRPTKIGLAQGQMRTGAYGSPNRLTYGVLGEKVNLAARLMSFAPSGEVYCDESVFTRVGRRWIGELAVLERLPERTTIPLGAVYRLSGETDVNADLIQPGTGLVGRGEELHRLESALYAAARGEPALVLLSGEAGIGKSHLVQAFSERAEMQGFNLIRSEASSIESCSPYWIWRSILHGLLRLDSSAEKGWDEQIESTLALVGPESRARAPVLNDILNLGIPENDVTRKLPANLRFDNIVLMVAALLRLRAVERPLLVFFEDAHWMDDLSWELSGRIARLLAGDAEQVGFLWAARPFDLGGSPVFAGLEQAGLVRMDLQGLHGEDLDRLAEAELGVAPGRLSGDIRRILRDKSEGNPFYAREMILALKERRLIWYLGAGAESPWQTSEDFERAASALPDTLQGLILARIDLLGLEEQAVLKAASVIGRTFDSDMLNAALLNFAPSTAPVLDSHLRALLRENLLVREGSTYSFNHIMTRDTAYNTLLYAQRRELHGVVAGWFEDRFSGDRLEPYYPTLAYHYRHAEDAERELTYVCLSADHAQARYANKEALDFLDRALVLTTGPEDIFRLGLQREAILGLVGDRAAQLEQLQILNRLGQETGRDELITLASLRDAEFQRLSGNYDAALQLADRVAGQAVSGEDPALLAEATHLKALIYMQQSRHEQAERCLAESLPFFETSGDPSRVAEIHGDFGVLNVYRGDFRAAVPEFIQALALHKQAGSRREAARIQANLGGAYGYLGDTGMAVESYRQALHLSREIGDRRLAHIAGGNLGIAYGERGELASAMLTLQEALQVSRQLEDQRKEGSWLGNLGEISIALGRWGEAEAYLQEAIRICARIGNRNGLGMWLNRLGAAARGGGDRGAARRWIGQALQTNREIGNRSEAARSLLSLGLISLDEARWEAAQGYFLEAGEICEQLGQSRRAVDVLPGLAYAASSGGLGDEAPGLLDRFLESWKDRSPPERDETNMEVLWMAISALQHLGDERTGFLLKEVYGSLQARAALIGDSALRDEFLNSVRTNRLVADAQRAQAIV